MSKVTASERELMLLKENRPTNAVRRLLLNVTDNLEVALTHIDNQNYGLAKDWINEARRMLPEEGEVVDPPWPQSHHFAGCRDLLDHPDLAAVREIVIGGHPEITGID